MDEDLEMPFGKYEGESISRVYEDSSYRRWLLEQDWFEEKFPEHFEALEGFERRRLKW